MLGTPYSVLFVLFLRMPTVNGHPDNFEYIQSLDDELGELAGELSGRMNDLEDDVSEFENVFKESKESITRKVNRELRKSEVKWIAKLKTKIVPLVLPQLVTRAVKEMFQGTGQDEMATRAHVTEVKLLKQHVHLLKGQVRHLQGEMAEIREENTSLKKVLGKLSEDMETRNITSHRCDCLGSEAEEPFVITTLPPGLCALPVSPDLMAEGVVEGTRFGSMADSRHEHKSLPSRFRISSVFEVDFKTTAENGIILYLSDRRHDDYSALYMKNGHVVYAFNCGSGAAVITSPQKYNDGQLHHVRFARSRTLGILEIDKVRVGNGKSKGRTRTINVVSPYYVGGVPQIIKKKSSNNLQGVFGSFIGCLKDFKLNEKDFGAPSNQISIKPCSDAMEAGSFFTVDEGYVKLYDKFKVGLDLEIWVEIKPRQVTGVILAVHKGKGNYLVLQMVDGEIILTVDIGMGAISTKYSPPMLNTLCDGNWHIITALKAKEVVILTVDGTTAPRGQGKSGVSAADTNDPLYIGGVPDYSAKGITAQTSFVGCIRNLQLNGERQYVGSGDATGNVKMDSCPVN